MSTFTRSTLGAAAKPKNKRLAMLTMFVANLGTKFRTDYLHRLYGTSTRTRISEINRDPASPITILNHTEGDASCYWAVPRHVPESLFDLSPAIVSRERYRDDG